MRIRSKMFTLVSSAMAFMAIVAAVYLVSQGSRSRIEAERKVLLGLGDSVRDLIIAVNLLDSGQMDSSSARFDEKRAAAERSFDAIEGLKYLPRVNASLKESVEIIRNLRSLASDDLASLSSAYGALKADSVKYFMSSRETTLPQFYTDEYARKKYGLADVYQRLDAFSTLSAGLTETLVMSSDVIAEKNLLIDKELEEANARSLAFASSIGAALVALILFMSFVVSRSLAKPIVTIERTIESLGSGDLRERAVVATRDELGRLGGELNDFLESLSASIGEIQSVSKENAELKRVLAQSLAGASSSAVEIDANAASIKRQIEGLDAQIARARSALEEMGKGLSEYAQRVEAQDAMIASSSSSIEEVIESIGSISGIAESDREATEGLVKATAESRVVFGVTFEGLSGIAKSVEDINEMASVIQDIASRTNLLAMNAAIEAAHAGESGKGFSVVADEIRKLALAASESSKRIEETIRSVGERMSRAASSRDKSSASFNAMDGQIRKVANSASEIDGHLAGIRDKAGAVLQSMRELRAASKSTAAESSVVEHAASSVSEAMAETTRVSQEVRSNIAEIVTGLGEISSSVQEVASLSEKLGEAGTRLDSAVNAFTI